MLCGLFDDVCSELLLTRFNLYQSSNYEKRNVSIFKNYSTYTNMNKIRISNTISLRNNFEFQNFKILNVRKNLVLKISKMTYVQKSNCSSNQIDSQKFQNLRIQNINLCIQSN